MSDLYWLRRGWTDALCSCCGVKIYPEGDPDWGMCFACFTENQRQEEPQHQTPENTEGQS